ncbi:hypothetical protein [Flavobacterium terrisoli]|uniref:hypothetical protein n=1 Tax=Flavobacterium terrisoli TaxID=3242195 RepID=UPI0025438F36|nr:hypothetical protein [Flavobacterium buctense]
MKKIHSLLWLLFLVVSFSACESNDDSNGNQQNDDTFAENFGNETSKDFIGQVVDTDNHPIQGATIQIGSSTVQTDVNGVFIINGANVHDRFAYITATKAGYINGSRAMVPTGGKNNVRIMLIPNTPIETIQSGVTSEVAMPNGTKVVFDGAFQDENGMDYSGSVQVAMFHLLPSDENISKLMPGMLYAQTETNEEAVLETYGMLNVELRGSGGQKLNIKEGHTAEIEMKIDDAQMTTAPSSIPLWHFDEEKGYWKEDGVATKVGNKYVGEVSHFSWWNCDVQFPTVNFTATIVDVNNNPVSNIAVAIVFDFPRTNLTDDSGNVSGLIPANQVMTLNIYDVCGNIIYTSQIGPYSQNTNLGQIQLPGSSIQTANVSGSLLKCDNTIVTNGYVVLKNGNRILISGLDNGNYDFTTVTCSGSNNFTIEGFDFDTLQSTGELNYQFEFPETHINALQACNAITEYITFNINGENTIVTGNISSQIFLNTVTYGNNIFANQMTIYANYGNVPGGGAIQTPGVAIECGSTIPGNYTLNNTSVRISTQPSSTPNQYFFIYGPPEISNYNFRIIKFGAVGDYIDVSFTGDIEILGVSYLVNGIAHVIRDH